MIMRQHIKTFGDFLNESHSDIKEEQSGYEYESTDLDLTDVPEEEEPKKPVDLVDKRQISIAKDTVRNPKKGLLLGGTSVEQAEKILKKFGYTDEQIEKLKQ